jgi:hypothetical protein
MVPYNPRFDSIFGINVSQCGEPSRETLRVSNGAGLPPLHPPHRVDGEGKPEVVRRRMEEPSRD